jgi:hypothetical protein
MPFKSKRLSLSIQILQKKNDLRWSSALEILLAQQGLIWITLEQSPPQASFMPWRSSTKFRLIQHKADMQTRHDNAQAACANDTGWAAAA